MKIKEVKQMVEQVIRTEYYAEDGTYFRSKEECEKYEESALFAVSKQLKRIDCGIRSHYDIDDGCSDECLVEVFDIQTEKDLEMLRRYLYLKASSNGASEKSINGCMTSINECRKDFVFENVTYGHEVIVFWSYDVDWFWTYGDGSINGYADYFRNRLNKLIYPVAEENK